jgi:MYXO-CTERM domain-containing protein
LGLLASPVRGQQIKEDFSSPLTIKDGTKIGKCQQLTASLFNKGVITVIGDNSATLNTGTESDVAMFASTYPLPSSGYKVTIGLSEINYQQYSLENGTTLMLITNAKPQPASEAWWSNHRMLAVEVSILPGATNKHPMFINFFDASTMYTWDGNNWTTTWAPVITYDPSEYYEITVEKKSGTYTLTVTESGTQLAKASVAASKVLPATSEYFVVGDRLNNFFKGVLDVNEITMPQPPGCGTDAGLPVPPDASVADTSSPPKKDMGAPDAKPADGKPTTKDKGPASDGKPTQKDGPKPATDGKPASGDGKGGAWDLFTPDLGGSGEDDGGACGCRLAAAPPSSSHLIPVTLVSLLGLLFFFRRRFR